MRAPDETAPSALPKIRPATAGDLDALATLEAACFGDAAWSRRLIAEELEASTALVLVAEAEGRATIEPPDLSRAGALAYACFRRTAGESELLRIATSPAARRRGIAVALIRTGLERLRIEGIGTCFLEVADKNAPAFALYRRLGFREIGRRPGYYERRSDALLLQLDLVGSGADERRI